MAQGNSKLLFSAWEGLPNDDRRVLGEELARTGCEGQKFVCDAMKDFRGPAFLVYYGPAFLQKAGLLDPLGALRILAEILRKARTMWPLMSSWAGATVVIRIDLLKAETVQACSEPMPGEAWCLERVSERSCAVARANLRSPWMFDSSRCLLDFPGSEGASANRPDSPASVSVAARLQEEELRTGRAVGTDRSQAELDGGVDAILASLSPRISGGDALE
mmetsp:Transcript_2036/g.6165  ORF Transcript_2036/g.6165 Transcript_2036/m.6165 type:complete len:219 (-) Transcript_2036:165-821(-)